MRATRWSAAGQLLYPVAVEVDWFGHRLKCRLHKRGHHRLFRLVRRVCGPVCHWVRLMEHAREPGA